MRLQEMRFAPTLSANGDALSMRNTVIWLGCASIIKARSHLVLLRCLLFDYHKDGKKNVFEWMIVANRLDLACLVKQDFFR